MQSLYDCPKLHLFGIDSIEIIIEFLYQKFKSKALQYNFPMYMVNLIIFLITITLHENGFDKHEEEYVSEMVTSSISAKGAF